MERTRTKSNTQVGNDFRDQVAALLRTKYENVQTEKTILGKDVDIVYSEIRFSKKETIAVECKNLSRPVTATEIYREIFPDYVQLLNKGRVTLVLIVANRPLASAARERVDSDPRFIFLTAAELEESMLGLMPYVKGLSRLGELDGLDDYFVEGRLKHSELTAVTDIEHWIESGSNPALAVLGGYGQGKTSLATRLASMQAKKYLNDHSQRIPIFIRLGAVVHETTLEALFGREFTSSVRSNYNFSTFMHLNKTGRLLIILDGFDEMQHGMRSSDFRANFGEFNRLLTENARVILLGRPNAFLSQDNKKHVLSGIRRIGHVEIRQSGMAEWDQREIALFSEGEAETFLARYMRKLINDRVADVARQIREGKIASRIKEITETLDKNLYCRPVHARIIAELAVDPDFSFARFSEYDLYSQFLVQLLERDAEQKRARRPISVAERMKFQERLAYWAWTRKNENQGVFLKRDIPEQLLTRLADGGTEDLEAKMMEYIVSTVTDEKEGGRLGFSHRSFQEFLVAEYLRHIDPSQVVFNCSDISSAIDDAVVDFLLQAPSSGFHKTWFLRLAQSWSTVSQLFLDLLLTDSEVCEALHRKIVAAERYSWMEATDFSPAEVAMVGLAGIHLQGDPRFPSISRALRNILLNDSANSARMALLFLLLLADAGADLIRIGVDCLFSRPARLQVQARKESKRTFYTDDLIFRLFRAGLEEDPAPAMNGTVRVSPAPAELRLNALAVFENVQRLVRTEVELSGALLERKSKLPTSLLLTSETLANATRDIQIDELIEVHTGSLDPFARARRSRTVRAKVALD